VAVVQEGGLNLEVVVEGIINKVLVNLVMVEMLAVERVAGSARMEQEQALEISGLELGWEVSWDTCLVLGIIQVITTVVITTMEQEEDGEVTPGVGVEEVEVVELTDALEDFHRDQRQHQEVREQEPRQALVEPRGDNF